MLNFIYYLFVFNLIFNLANADEAAALCAFVTATNINSKRNEWRCDNIEIRCFWSGITCQDMKISKIELFELGLSGNNIK